MLQDVTLFEVFGLRAVGESCFARRLACVMCEVNVEMGVVMFDAAAKVT